MKKTIKQKLDEILYLMTDGDITYFKNNWYCEKNGKDYELFPPGNMQQPDVVAQDRKVILNMLLNHWISDSGK